MAPSTGALADWKVGVTREPRFMESPDLQSLDAQRDHEPFGAPTWSRLKAFATSKAGYKPALRGLRFMGRPCRASGSG